MGKLRRLLELKRTYPAEPFLAAIEQALQPTLELADLAVRWKGRGVVAFDLAGAAALALSLAACSSDDDGDEATTDDTATEEAGGETDDAAAGGDFPEGSTMADIAAAGEVTIGTKFDQPGFGLLNPATNEPEGFDDEVAKIIADQLALSIKTVEFHRGNVMTKLQVESVADLVKLVLEAN